MKARFGIVLAVFCFAVVHVQGLDFHTHLETCMFAAKYIEGELGYNQVFVGFDLVDGPVLFEPMAGFSALYLEGSGNLDDLGDVLTGPSAGLAIGYCLPLSRLFSLPVFLEGKAFFPKSQERTYPWVADARASTGISLQVHKTTMTLGLQVALLYTEEGGAVQTFPEGYRPVFWIGMYCSL